MHNYVIVETVALLRRRLGWEEVRKFLRDAGKFQNWWVDEALHRAAVERMLNHRGRYSLVDEVSFLVMQTAGIKHALAFDDGFAREGFILL